MSEDVGMGKKTLSTKRRLASATKRARAVPAWVRLRTGNEVSMNKRQRNWRRSAGVKPR
ncbi:MAG: 60S ribosomal protein L39 [Thaumarchaeota archaeon]|nr:60S ribosomal protein L39 [Candidatus Calditenuaceae archaeon]MDW8187065.1 60S ribosomal protein L39 [Nitrososphaerota archaeon]